MNQLITQIKKYQIITFDVFDTLITRDVYEPQDVFYFVEKRYNNLYHCNCDFMTKRINAEKNARKKYTYTEINLYEIYEELKRDFPEDICRRLQQMEINAEIAICCANPEMNSCYEFARLNDKRIFIITDMYLPKAAICRILSKNGYFGYEDILISGEYHQTKSEGNLFKTFLQKYHLEASDVLHIGDNIRADVKSPNKNNIAAFHYTDSRQFLPHCVPKQRKDLGKTYTALCVFLKNHCSSNWFRSYQMGYALYGPLLWGYTQWLNEQCKRDHIDKILFLSRDGFILQKAFQKLNDGIENSYFYISRKAVIGALLHYDCSLNDTLKRYRSWPYKFTFELFLNKVNLPKSEISELNKIDLKTEFTLEEFVSNKKNIEAYKKIKPLIDKKSIVQEKLLLEYINGYQLQGKRVALVDIGGNRTIATNIQELLTRNKFHVKLFGKYMEISSEENRNIQAYLYSKERNHDLKRMIPFYYYFLEIFLSAPHGSTSSYKACDQNVQPVLEPNEFDKSDLEPLIVKTLHEGSLQFCQDFNEIGSKYLLFSPSIAIYNLQHFGIYPSNADIRYWKDFRFNADRLTPMIKRRNRLFYITHFKALIVDYKESLWKAGFLGSLMGSSTYNSIFIRIKIIVNNILG